MSIIKLSISSHQTLKLYVAVIILNILNLSKVEKKKRIKIKLRFKLIKSAKIEFFSKDISKKPNLFVLKSNLSRGFFFFFF